MSLVAAILFALALLTGGPGSIRHPPHGAQVGTATVFYSHHDPGVNFNACWTRAPGVPKVLDDDALVFAHRRLPCGSYALLVNVRTRRMVVARKTDWGPREGLVDLSRATARAIGLNGKERVVLIPLAYDASLNAAPARR